MWRFFFILFSFFPFMANSGSRGAIRTSKRSCSLGFKDNLLRSDGSHYSIHPSSLCHIRTGSDIILRWKSLALRPPNLPVANRYIRTYCGRIFLVHEHLLELHIDFSCFKRSGEILGTFFPYLHSKSWRNWSEENLCKKVRFEVKNKRGEYKICIRLFEMAKVYSDLDLSSFYLSEILFFTISKKNNHDRWRLDLKLI